MLEPSLSRKYTNNKPHRSGVGTNAGVTADTNPREPHQPTYRKPEST